MPHLFPLISIVGTALLLVLNVTVQPALAETAPAPKPSDSSPSSTAAAPNQPQLVFTMGVVEKVGRDAVAVRFEDGQTERYQITDTTTFQTESGGTSSVAELHVGDMVMIIAPEDASTALTVVDAGDRGFDAGGPFDIGPDEGA